MTLRPKDRNLRGEDLPEEETLHYTDTGDESTYFSLCDHTSELNKHLDLAGATALLR